MRRKDLKPTKYKPLDTDMANKSKKCSVLHNCGIKQKKEGSIYSDLCKRFPTTPIREEKTYTSCMYTVIMQY